MDVEIFHFKNYVNFSISITNGTTLIKGDSGIGKSNIFEAITWALYGSIREIDPWSNPSAKTKVIIRYKNLIIQRTRRPTNFIVTTSDGDFGEPYARDIVEKHFGTKVIWECTAYLDEDLSNTLFSLTSKQRLNILNILTFPGNNPEDKIEEINMTISEQRSKYELAQEYYNLSKLEYEKWWEIHSIDIKAIEEEGIPKYPIEELRRNLKRMNDGLIDLKSEETRQKMLKNRLLTIDKELEEAEIVLSRQIDISGLEKKLTLALKREKLESSLYFKIDVKIDKFSEDDYREILETELAYDRYQKVRKKYQLRDELDHFSSEVEKLRDIVARANTDFYPLVKRKGDLAKQLQDVSPGAPSNIFTQEDVHSAYKYEQNEISNMKLQSEIMQFKLDMSVDRMKEIIRNEGKHILIKKKRELKAKLESLGNIEPSTHHFNHKNLYETKEIERKRKIIVKYDITRDHFDHIEDIEMIQRLVVNKCITVPPKVVFTQTDYHNAKKLALYRRKYGISDFGKLLESINQNRLYKTYHHHIALYKQYGDEIDIDPIPKEEYERIIELHGEIEQISEPLECPHCSNSVYYNEHSSKLSKFTQSFSEKEKQDIVAKYSKYQRINAIISTKDKIIKNHGPFPSIENLKIYTGYTKYLFAKDFSDDLVNIEDSPEKIKHYLSFKEEYDKLPEYSKIYFDDGSMEKYFNRLDGMRAIERYYEDPEFSSEYIQQCMNQDKLYQKYQKIKSEYDDIEVEDIEFYEDDIDKVRKCLALHQQIKKQKIDPPKFSSSYMKECIDQEQKYLQYIKIKEEYDSIQIPDQLILSPKELELSKLKLRDLERVEFAVKPKYSSVYVKNSIEKTKLLKELQSYPDKTSSEIICARLTKDKEIQRQQDCMVMIRDKLRAEKSTIVIDDTVTHRLAKIQDDILSYEDEIDATMLYNEYILKRDRKDKCYSDVQMHISKLSKAEELLRIATDTMYQILSTSVSDINAHIKKIISIIFNDPIEIKLDMFKQLKSKSVVKPEVTLEVRYRGGVLNSIKRLSKGERARITLAVTLALNKISNLPILLLDETMAHIDQNMKENVTAILKEYATHRPLVIIAHDIITGLYDNLVEL